jgi:8-amino-7-oxononanoate synthase
LRAFSDLLESELQALERADRLRACPPLSGPSRQRPFVQRAGQSTQAISFCSNDYLGLASHPDVLSAAAAAALAEGFGAGSARLVSGDLPSHRRLELSLAAFLRRPSALLFPSGYQANVGTLAALASRQDLIVSDAANHASLIDGCRLSRATVAVYPHGDASAAAQALARPGFRRRILVTESLFSMDGDSPPLPALAQAAVDADAIFIVDEAHALGSLGPGGRGLCAAAQVEPDVLIGTLGKAFGAAGGFVTGPASLRAFLLNRARTFVFATAPPPPVAAAAQAALGLISGPDGDVRRARLLDHGAHLLERVPRLGASATASVGPIYPVILGEEARALAAAAHLSALGLFAPAIRPPTVPDGTARLRITLSSEHNADEIDRLAEALREVLP